MILIYGMNTVFIFFCMILGLDYADKVALWPCWSRFYGKGQQPRIHLRYEKESDNRVVNDAQ